MLKTVPIGKDGHSLDIKLNVKIELPLGIASNCVEEASFHCPQGLSGPSAEVEPGCAMGLGNEKRERGKNNVKNHGDGTKDSLALSVWPCINHPFPPFAHPIFGKPFPFTRPSFHPQSSPS
jgi:hypothetical protein